MGSGQACATIVPKALDKMSNRFGALDGLRAISILLVIAAHLLPLGPKVLMFNDTAGAMGMSLFFSLSGFLITTNLLSGQSAVSFLIRRFARILPLAYAYLAFVFLIVTFNPSALLGSFFFVENYEHQYLHQLNGHFWSLCVEMHFYIAVGLTVLLLGRRGVWLVVPACVLITLLRITDGSVINIKTHLRVDEILAGACIAIAYHNMAKIKIANLVWISLFVLLFASCWPGSGALQYFRPYCACLVLGASLRLERGAILSALTSKPMRYVAEISYALYVIHPLMASGWMNEGATWQKYLLKRPISIATTFALAHLSTFRYEKKCIELGKRFSMTRKMA
ncbi:acyltransferase [Bradyrhizobium sp. sBnM-33]|uniref:acyltransferase family protein n=2 Tax=unclassified Bradyrhizobium TaxID=2631580 RepID=UPI001BCEC0FD|nr:acyltransferase [Bradyrhizobium sp. sBnM-33]WOH53726.1 acyltransferase [Bradyrhizobium sp. sBnM-33]